MNELFNPKLTNQLYKTGIIAVLVIEDAKDAVPLAHALLDGGVNIMELTLRTPVAMDALREIKENVPEMIAGVGTVITTEQVEHIARVGAHFGVAPGMNPGVVKKAKELGLPFSPGIATPSDIEQALELDCRILKFFPAEPSGGLSYLKSIANPYGFIGLKYIPLGGLNQENFRSYIESPLVIAVGGSWLAKKELIQKKDWKKVTENARMARALVKNVRGE